MRRSARRRRTVSAYREGDAHDRAPPGPDVQGRGAALGRARWSSGSTARDRRRRPSDDAAAGPGRAAVAHRTSAGAPARAGALGRQPAAPAGAPARRSTARSGCPRGSRACPPGSSTTCCCTSSPTCSRPATARDFWALLERLPAAGARPRLPRRVLDGRPASGGPTTRLGTRARARRRPDDSSREPRDRQRATRARTEASAPSGSASTGRPPHVERLGADHGRRPRGASGHVLHVEVVARAPGAGSAPVPVEHAPGRRRPARGRDARSPRGLAQRGPGQGGVAGLEWPPSCSQRPTLACSVSSTCAAVRRRARARWR